jgi:natural product biosynthesis luciferase-like monooxygenase protein
LGANVLTHMSTQTIDELNGHIASYRAALVENGHDPATREVSLMLHTYVGESDRAVKDAVRQPMYEYLRSNLALHARQAQERQSALSASGFSRDDELALLEHAFERYYQDRALFGSPRTCALMLERLAAVGVTEIACLVDFGLPREGVLEGIRWLSTLFPSTDRQSASSAA